MSELPYQAEYAKTGRASCKGCKQKIDQGELRIAIMVQSAFFDGKQPNWFHKDCFFKKHHPSSVDDIANFIKLKSADQKSIKTEVENASTAVVMPVETGKGKGKKGKGIKRAAEVNNSALKDFCVEYSKSSRATCRHCEIKICKSEVRISKTVYDSEIGSKFGGQPLWHHVKCFAECRNELLYFAGGEFLPGFKMLSEEDQEIVKNEIKAMKTEEVPIKKIKEEPKDAEEKKKEAKLEKEMEKQNKLYHKCRSTLSQLSKIDAHALLKLNSQDVPPGLDECLDRLADCMAFGALKPCPECKNGQLVLDTFGYKCTGYLSEYTKCNYITQDPERQPMTPSDSSIFVKFKPKTSVRLFRAAPRPTTVIIKEEPAIKKEVPIPPLKNLQFFLYGRMKNKENIKNRILKLGGLVVSKLTDTLAAVVSTETELEKMNDKMAEIQEQDIEVVTESFLDLIDPEKGTVNDSLQIIKENNIASWGSDPLKRVPQDVIDGKSIPKSGSMYVKSTKSAVKLKIKGGTAVDPASGLDEVAHVYRNVVGDKYTVVLSQTDVAAGKNSFYKLQVLEANDKKKYWVFTSWGRIGTTIGGNKVEPFPHIYNAVNKFENIFLEKTDNHWQDKNKFKKVPGKYQPLDVDYGNEDEDGDPNEKLKVDAECKLPMPVQRLIVQIFDIDTMKKTLLEFELDTEKMPLGKLSKKQIKSGYKVLSELINYIEKGQTSSGKILDATNRFYTLVPHDFGVQNPPLLDNIEVIKNKTAMLDNLLEIEIAYNLLKSDDDEVIPIEAHYLKLKADITPLDRNSPEFELIEKYVTNTHAATHSNYSLEIDQVFKVVRSGEEKRYKPFKKLHNRRLLWHGSRVTNFAGILSQGLRIAPPEAPVTGYMFGKGIYFADMVSKSANYTCASPIYPLGVMLLCEVALGDMKECTKAEYITKLPAGKHSTWGKGRTQPDPTQSHVLDNGAIIPLGPAVNTNTDCSLLYNEFIVYDVAQVNVKYLLQMKFNFR